MKIVTQAVRPFITRSLRGSEVWMDDCEPTQRVLLAWLLTRGRATAWGKRHGFDRIKSYEDFRNLVAITPYEETREAVMSMIGGARNVLWPGLTRNFAQSSGTSDGRSKFIPITNDSLQLSHYGGGREVVARYLALYPDSRLFDGRSLILGGSFANTLNFPKGSHARVGDLSATLIDRLNPLAAMVRTPNKKTALMADWQKKLPRLAEAAARRSVTNISGVPSWMHTVLREVLRLTGASELHEVWPHLEVFFHGGISMEPYRGLYDEIIDRKHMRYMETYNASEGFFGVQDRPDVPGMLLLMNHGTFYEFQPLEKYAAPIPSWQVEAGKTYSLIITSCNGLWRYPIGDTVEVVSTYPLRIIIAGRTKHYINAFGEEVMVHNTDAALTWASQLTGARVLNYTAAPVFTTAHSRGRHQWLIEFDRLPEGGIEHFADELDQALQQENSDYQAKRSGGIFLDRLSVTAVERGFFDKWLASTGKLGGQRKVPRLANDRHIIDSMLAVCDSNSVNK